MADRFIHPRFLDVLFQVTHSYSNGVPNTSEGNISTQINPLNDTSCEGDGIKGCNPFLLQEFRNPISSRDTSVCTIAACKQEQTSSHPVQFLSRAPPPEMAIEPTGIGRPRPSLQTGMQTGVTRRETEKPYSIFLPTILNIKHISNSTKSTNYENKGCATPKEQDSTPALGWNITSHSGKIFIHIPTRNRSVYFPGLALKNGTSGSAGH